MLSTKYWIWYPGDFSIHQGMLQNFSREERGMGWPAYWYMDDCNRNVKFTRTYQLESPTQFTVYAHGTGYVDVNNTKYQLGKSITCGTGKNIISIFVGNTQGLPTVFIEGKIINSSEGWQVSNFVKALPAAHDPLFTDKLQDPNVIKFNKLDVNPIKIEAINDGVLFDFGRAVNGSLRLKLKRLGSITLCYGESKDEALDVKMCYYKQDNVTESTPIRKRAFRYVFVPSILPDQLSMVAIHEYIPKPNISEFKSDDELVNRIWNVSTETLKLCSDVFFIDGIKRDRWIWAGDAYQANFINQYSFFDEDVDKRTLLALRGQDNIKQHINTIVDYSMLWVIGILNHYEMTGDIKFLKVIFPRMKSMVQYFINQTNGKGFIYGRKDDWIFIDWSEMDKDGTVAAEQALLLQVYKTMITCGNVLGEPVEDYNNRYRQLLNNFIDYFWDEAKGAFVDSYESGKRHVTRHANIFAILFNLVEDRKKQLILKNVLLNDEITQITTPYFKFFEQDALCQLGQQSIVYQEIIDYWGGMINKGAVTFWEEYDPSKHDKGIYAMYGDPYGKSLCHAWGASPIYLLGRYFVGLYPTKPGYREFKVSPKLTPFKNLHVVLPVKDGKVTVDKTNNQISVVSTRPGGTFVLGSKQYSLRARVPVTVDIPGNETDLS